MDYTPEQIARAEGRFRNPKPGGRIEAALKHGIDFTEVIANLKLTPSQRVQKLQAALRSREGGGFRQLPDPEGELLELEAILEATED